jgi:hypothetical protein
MAAKEKVRPIYAELQGYMLQAPGGDNVRVIYDPNVWRHYNQTVDELTKLTGNNYDRFKAVHRYMPSARTMIECVDVTQYRTKLSGLINRLHAEFFADEASPFAGSPGMVINQSQQQSQAVHIQMVMEITEQLTRAEAKFEEGDKERGFIDKVKGYLKSAGTATTSLAQLMLLLLNVARECGLSIEDMKRVFGD